MSAKNVTAAKEALAQVLADVKEAIGSESAAAKISFLNYKARNDALVENLTLLEEDFFGDRDEGPAEEPEEKPEEEKPVEEKPAE